MDMVSIRKMTKTYSRPLNLFTYIIFITLALGLTLLLNYFHSYLIGIRFKPVSMAMPAIAGIVFGYLLAKNHLLHKHLARQASIDVLTGTYNRMQCNYFLLAEVDKSNRYGGTFSIISIDIDHFKAVNDQYGHPVGDSVLSEFSNLVGSLNRSSDIFSRYGGEEFIIIAHATNISNATQHAERLRQNIEKHNFKTVGDIRCSFGVTEFRKDRDTVKSIIKRADDALYKAKNSGRNQVIEF